MRPFISAHVKAQLPSVFSVVWSSLQQRLGLNLPDLSLVARCADVPEHQRIRVLPSTEVADALAAMPSATSFSITAPGERGFKLLLFSYSLLDDQLSLILDGVHSHASMDPVIQDWFAVMAITNVCMTDPRLAIAMRSHREKPGSNNLFQFPCFQNARECYLEGVSADMWLGNNYWQYAHCTKRECKSQDWLHVEERETHVYVRAWPKPFTSCEGEELMVQRRLLNFFFGISG